MRPLRILAAFVLPVLLLASCAIQAVTVYRLSDDYQFFDSNGDPLNGGLLYTYTAGTTNAKATYQDSAGSTVHSNPIVLDSAGRLPADVFGTTGAYKLVLKTSSGSTVWTRDNITGINDTATATISEWLDSGLTPTYVGATSFTVSGDQTTALHGGRRLKIVDSGGTQYSTITGSSYSAPDTTVTVANDSSTIDSGISEFDIGIVSTQNTSLVGYKLYARHTYTFDGTDIFVDGVDQNNADNTITWTKPTGLRAVRVTVVGGGGGSGYCDSAGGQACAGSGGGGGGTAIEFITTLNNATETVTVGAGGTAGAYTGAVAAGAGGTSSFGPGTPYLQATGGAAGSAGTSGSSVSALTTGSLGGVGSNGDLNIRGGNGGPAFRFSGTSTLSGFGGNSTLGGGAPAVVPDTAGTAGGAYGGGASGAASNNGADRDGAAGAAGIVIVEEYY